LEAGGARGGEGRARGREGLSKNCPAYSSSASEYVLYVVPYQVR